MKDVAKILVQQGIAVFAHGHRNHGILTADFKDACTGEKAWFYKEVEDINNTALY